MYKGLFISASPIDMTNAIAQNGFVCTGDMRVVFKTDKWYKLTGGTLVEVTQDITVDSVLDEGNTSDDLRKVTSVPEFLGKDVLVAIAVSTTDKVMPKVRLSGRKTVRSIALEKEFESDEYTTKGSIFETSDIIDGDVTVTVSGFRDGSWTDYLPISKFSGKYDKVKIKAVAKVSKIGDTSSVKSVTLLCKPDDSLVPGATVDFIIDSNLSDDIWVYARQNDGVAKAYSSERTLTEKQIAVEGNTGKQTIKLTDTGVDFANLKIYSESGSVPFDFNTDSNSLSFISTSKVVIVYQYGLESEDWKELSPIGNAFSGAGGVVKVQVTAKPSKNTRHFAIGTYYLPNVNVTPSDGVSYVNNILTVSKEQDVTYESVVSVPTITGITVEADND